MSMLFLRYLSFILWEKTICLQAGLSEDRQMWQSDKSIFPFTNVISIEQSRQLDFQIINNNFAIFSIHDMRGSSGEK